MTRRVLGAQSASGAAGLGVHAATLVLLASLAALSSTAGAQVRPPTQPPRRPTPTRPAAPPAQQAGDTAARAPGDSTAPKELVKWAEPDSVMQALQERQGYSVTRYQGDQVTFEATRRVLTLRSDSGAAPAAVARGQTLLVGHVVVYDDSAQVVRAQGDPSRGDSVVLRDPSQGSDVLARGSIEYDIVQKRARVSNISTEVMSGENWIVGGKTAVYRGSTDSTRADEKAFYVLNGTVTSCDDPVPDYHFEAREIKLISKKVLVARPAVLYIADIPVMVLPFLFQDLRSGRRSGMLTPRFGVNELFRNSPSYRRHFDNLGYYFALSDYTDAQLWLDWRSGEGATSRTFGIADPGWTRINGEWRYRWLDRFLLGRLSASYLRQRDGQENRALSWNHQQDFSQSSRLTANVNYVSSTQLQRQNTFNPIAVLATIASQVTFSNKVGPFSLQTGGSRTQYSGREQVQQTLPSLSISTEPISLASWLVWTPSFSGQNVENLKNDQPGAGSYRYFTNAFGAPDSARVLTNDRNTSLSFTTPLRIFNFTWNNSFTAIDRENGQATTRQVDRVVRAPNGVPLVGSDGRDSIVSESRRFGSLFETQVDWQTSISLPSLFQSTWRITPSVGIVNVAGGPYWVRSSFSNGAWVNQRKRLQYSVSASPTFFGLFSGFGPVGRFRHAISPTVSYSFAPAADVSDEYLHALGASRRSNLSGLLQSAVSLGLSTNLEAKLRGGADTTAGGTYGDGTKVKVVAINFDQLSYDFAKLSELRRRSRDPVRFPDAEPVSNWAGLTTDRVGATLTSDLLPGFTLRTRWSLLEGSPQSDTAVFKPFREEVSATFSFNQTSGIFAALSRIFGRPVEQKTPGTPKLEQAAQTSQDAMAQQILSQPVAGSAARDAQFAVPTGRGWQGSFTFSDSRQRPIRSGTAIIITAADICRQFQQIDPVTYQACLISPTTYGAQTGFQGTDLNANQIGQNAPIFRTPPLTTLQSQMSFNITPKWAASWGTTYDFRAKDFASQMVTVQRELHDWRAIFAFTKGPNGNFAFNFFIALNAQPDLKLNFDRRSYRTGSGVQ